MTPLEYASSATVADTAEHRRPDAREAPASSLLVRLRPLAEPATAVVLLALVGVLVTGRGDGQPALVFGGRTGGSDELADSDGALGGLWLRSMLFHAGTEVVTAWLLVTLINLRNTKASG